MSPGCGLPKVFCPSPSGIVFSPLRHAPLLDCSFPNLFRWSLVLYEYGLFSSPLKCDRKTGGGWKGREFLSPSEIRFQNCAEVKHFPLETRILLWRLLWVGFTAVALPLPMPGIGVGRVLSQILPVRTWWGSWRENSGRIPPPGISHFYTSLHWASSNLSTLPVKLPTSLWLLWLLLQGN